MKIAPPLAIVKLIKYRLKWLKLFINNLVINFLIDKKYIYIMLQKHQKYNLYMEGHLPLLMLTLVRCLRRGDR